MCTYRRTRPTYSPAVRELVIDLVEDEGYTYQAAAFTAGVAEPTAWKWHQEFKRAGCELNQQMQAMESK